MLAIAPPGCDGCGALDLDGLRGFGGVAALGGRLAGGTGDVVRLTWRDDIGALYARDGELRLILIDAEGVIGRIADGPNAVAELAQALRADE